jgi:hypothetical protein
MYIVYAVVIATWNEVGVRFSGMTGIGVRFKEAQRLSSTLLWVRILWRFSIFGVLCSDSWSSSLLCWWVQGTRKSEIGLEPRGIVANGNACPLLWCILVECCSLQLRRLWCCQFASGLVVACGPSLLGCNAGEQLRKH